MHNLGCLVAAFVVGSTAGVIPAVGVNVALGTTSSQAAAATWLLVAIVAGVATFRRLRKRPARVKTASP